MRMGHANFDFNLCSILQNVVFSNEKSLDGQSHFSSDSNHQIKNSIPSSKISNSPTGNNFPYSLMLLRKVCYQGASSPTQC